jgi:hypothetical protein
MSMLFKQDDDADTSVSPELLALVEDASYPDDEDDNVDTECPEYWDTPETRDDPDDSPESSDQG